MYIIYPFAIGADKGNRVLIKEFRHFNPFLNALYNSALLLRRIVAHRNGNCIRDRQLNILFYDCGLMFKRVSVTVTV